MYNHRSSIDDGNGRTSMSSRDVFHNTKDMLHPSWGTWSSNNSRVEKIPREVQGGAKIISFTLFGIFLTFFVRNRSLRAYNQQQNIDVFDYGNERTLMSSRGGALDNNTDIPCHFERYRAAPKVTTQKIQKNAKVMMLAPFWAYLEILCVVTSHWELHAFQNGHGMSRAH